MTSRRIKDWFYSIWTGRPRPRVDQIAPLSDDDPDKLKQLIEHGDPADPRTLEQIAALLGQSDRTRI